MQRRHTTPAALLPPQGPPMPHGVNSAAHRPRQPSAVRMRALSLPKSATRPITVASADPIPWDRSLRSSQPTYIPGPGFNSTRRPSSKNAAPRPHPQHPLPELRHRAASAAVPLTAAVVAAAAAASAYTPAPPPPLTETLRGPVWRRTSAAFARSPLGTKDAASPSAFDGGLSTSAGEPSAASSFAGPSRRASAHAQRTLNVLLGADARDDAAALTAYTSPNYVIFAAYDTLRLLLVPLWRRYRRRKQVARATAIVAKFVLAKVHARRLRRKGQAAADLLRVLRAPRTLLLCTLQQVKLCVVRIQRAYRQHRRCVHAVVELNYRKVRRDVEEAYWASVVAQRESELAAQPPALTAVARAVQEVLEAKREVHTRFGTVRRASLATTTPAAVAPAPKSYELDVYNFYLIGRLPEAMLRFEIASAVFAHTRRSAVRACLLDALCTPKHPKAVPATRGVGAGWRAAASAKAAKPLCVAHLPRLLPPDVYTSVMNNTCYMTSLLRDDAMLRAHLRPSASHLEPY